MLHNKNKYTKKIAIIGCGNVGASAAYALYIQGEIDELLLMDHASSKAEAIALDLNHSAQFAGITRVKAIDQYTDLKDIHVAILCAGRPQAKGESRRNLAYDNAPIIESIVKKLVRFNKKCIILVVTNPVDVLTYVALRASRFSPRQVFGTGTVLDTMRFRYLLGEHLGVHPLDIDAFILGEHGESEFAAWSHANVASIPLQNLRKYNQKSARLILKKTLTAAATLTDRGWSSRYAIGLAIREIVTAILRDGRKILPVSSFVHNYHGVHNVCLGVPCVLDSTGIKSQLLIPLSVQEKKALKYSAQMIQSFFKK